MKGMKVVITRESPHSGYGYYKAGDTGLIVGFTEGCAVVVKDNDDKFVKVELKSINRLREISMKQPLMLQSDCVECPYYDGFGQCIQYGNITEEIVLKCEFNKE